MRTAIRPRIDLISRGEGRRRIWRVLIPVILVLAYGIWPYITLWRINQALTMDEQQSLAGLVDLPAIQDQIQRRLNKDSESAIGPISDTFIDWLEQAIRRNGTAALEHHVTLEWVRQRLLAHTTSEQRFLDTITRAFFDSPLQFSLRIGAISDTPVFVRLTFQGIGWKITAVSY